MDAWLIIALSLVLAYALGYMIGGLAEVSRQAERAARALTEKVSPRTATTSSRAAAARAEGALAPRRAACTLTRRGAPASPASRARREKGE